MTHRLSMPPRTVQTMPVALVEPFVFSGCIGFLWRTEDVALLTKGDSALRHCTLSSEMIPSPNFLQGYCQFFSLTNLYRVFLAYQDRNTFS
jgi:hypothetical protein